MKSTWVTAAMVTAGLFLSGNVQPEGRAEPPYRANVVEQATRNTDYRRVVYTGPRTQIAVMSLPPGARIGEEVHARVEQIVVVVAGRGRFVVQGVASTAGPGEVYVIPPGVRHDVANAGSEALKLYTVYAPPVHPPGTVHPTREDAGHEGGY